METLFTKKVSQVFFIAIGCISKNDGSDFDGGSFRFVVIFFRLFYLVGLPKEKFLWALQKNSKSLP